MDSLRPRFTARLVAVLLAGLLLTVPLVACSRVEDAAVRKTVTEYNELLPAAYSRPEPSLMNGVTDDAEANRIVMYVLYLKKNDEIIDNRLLGLDIRGVEFTADASRATAKTVEQWEYRMLDAETRRPKGDYTRRTYEGTYTLRKSGEHWVVVRLDVDEKAGGGKP